MDLPSTQQKILDSAKRWFLERGFKSAPLRAIVNDAGFTLGAFYGYYKNKEELFYALTDETAQGVAAIVGSIPCGSPEEKEAQVEEYLPLSVSFFGKGDFYALRASGSSMTGAQIDDGDLVIIRQQHTAQVGEIVVALTDEDKNTLKRLLYDDDRQSYYLHPENKDMEDIYVSGLRVQGVATHVIKAL